jgi:hypothetical protein
VNKLSIALLLAASSVAAQRLTPDPAFARLPGNPIRIADSLRLDLKAAKLEPPLNVFPGPRGGLVVYAQWQSVSFFDSLGKRMWSKGKENEKREVGDVTAVGWDANGMWVSDAQWSQIALLDQYGNVTKSLELPSWVRPPFSNRRAFPVFESMRVLGRYDNGDLLVMPRGDNIKLGSATSFDPSATYLVRINEDGLIQRTIAKFPSNIVRRKDGKDEFSFSNPMNQWLYKVAPDGKRTVLVSVDTTAPKMDTVHVRALNDRGDTLWTQKFAYPALTYTETQVDSIARMQWGVYDNDYRERRAKHLPRRGITVTSVVLDVNSSVWLNLRGNGSTRPAVGFDASGKPIGKLLLPVRRSVRAANLGSIWIGESRTDLKGDLVRYRIAK